MSFTDIFYNSSVGQYTVLGTLAYSILLVAAVYLLYTKLFKARKIRVDKRFMVSLISFVIFGGLLRALGDVLEFIVFNPQANPIPVALKFFIVTPGIYFTVPVLALVTFFFSKRLEKSKKISYAKTMIWVGGTFSALTLAYLISYVSNYRGAIMALAMAGFWALALAPISLKFPEYLSKENLLILMAHMLDASATFTALQLHSDLGEKHVLPNLLIFNLGLGPWVMFALKLAIVWPVLYYIDKHTKDESYRNILKIVILILGLALGVRDLFVIGIFGTPLF